MNKRFYKLWLTSAIITVSGIIYIVGYANGAVKMKAYINNINNSD